ncbi:hypothetical protein RFI_19352 [Reticulomyxa filosa]|uniref:RGS domain-containing protein n=1 Tax=Reticulomyxa filosa TaxID=46433 RepID=X6MVV7_RETFI|nr:hypothetical protein RFI_19352 [Reticulomyxa filosa]|eukprot:ETO17954.1 hypothetical protein RFI_19352 [Reticulomyxa filosa]
MVLSYKLRNMVLVIQDGFSFREMLWRAGIATFLLPTLYTVLSGFAILVLQNPFYRLVIAAFLLDPVSMLGLYYQSRWHLERNTPLEELEKLTTVHHYLWQQCVRFVVKKTIVSPHLEKNIVESFPDDNTKRHKRKTHTPHAASVVSVQSNTFDRSNDGSVSPRKEKQQSAVKKMTTLSRSISHPDDKKIRFRDIISNPQTIDIFMKHLSKEFKLLLSVIEMDQFQQEVRRSYASDKDKIMDNNVWKTRLEKYNVTLPSNLPQSMIVFDKDGWSERKLSEILSNNTQITLDSTNKHLFQYKLVAFRLFHKYIKTGSEFELNISSGERLQFQVLMQNLIEWLSNTYKDSKRVSVIGKPVCSELDLFLLFDDCITTNRLLMNEPFIRFSITEEFQACEALLS